MAKNKKDYGKITLLLGDATKLSFPDNSVDLIIAHPPYLGASYNRFGGDPRKQTNYKNSKKRMLKMLKKATKECYRVLKPTGSFIISIGPVEHGDLEYLLQTVKTSKFMYLNKVMLNQYDENDPVFYTQEFIDPTYVAPWYHFVKTNNFYYNPFKVKKYNNPVWNFPFSNKDSEIDQWMVDSYPTVVDAANINTIKRFVEMYSKEGDLVVDPFGGTGIVAVASSILNRNAISNDISPEVIEPAKLRIMLTFGEKFLKENVKVVNNETNRNKKD